MRILLRIRAMLGVETRGSHPFSVVGLRPHGAMLDTSLSMSIAGAERVGKNEGAAGQVLLSL
jgi:hypothetical protein